MLISYDVYAYFIYCNVFQFNNDPEHENIVLNCVLCSLIC